MFMATIRKLQIEHTHGGMIQAKAYALKESICTCYVVNIKVDCDWVSRKEDLL